MFTDYTLKQYVDALASAEPTPGGGSAMALFAANCAALAPLSILGCLTGSGSWKGIFKMSL